MVGFVVNEKENTPVREKGKKGTGTKSKEAEISRRLSISESKSRPHYLRVITNRFQRKGGSGRGRITAHRPIHLDGSPYEFSSRSDREGNKRKSFTVYEDDMDCMSCSFKQPKFPIELGSSRNVPTVAGSKNATLERCRTLNDGGKWEQIAPTLVGQQEPKLHILESFTAFRARNKARFCVNLKPSLLEPANQQESGSVSLEVLAARWQRGGRRSLYTRRSLGMSELEDIKESFRKVEEQILEKEMHDQYLEKEISNQHVEKEIHDQYLEEEMHDQYLDEEMREQDFERENHEQDVEKKMHDQDTEKEMHDQDVEKEVNDQDAEKEMLEENLLDQGRSIVPVQDSVAREAAAVPVDAQENVRESGPEPFCSLDWELSSPRSGGLETEDETAYVDLSTPQLNVSKDKLRLNQEALFSESTSVILELGVSPLASDSNEAIEQLTPANLPTTGCSADDTPQQSLEELESELAQTVEAVQVWSVELDPSRRRRESEYYNKRHSPGLRRFVLSSSKLANQVPETTDYVMPTPTMFSDHVDRATQFNDGWPSSMTPNEFITSKPVNEPVQSCEGGLQSTDLPSSEKSLNEVPRDVMITASGFPSCLDHAAPDELETQDSFTDNERETQAWGDSKTTPTTCGSPWPDQSPVPPMRSSAQPSRLHEKAKSSFGSPSLQLEVPRRDDSMAATPLMLKPSFDTFGMSLTPPRNPCLLFGDPFMRQMNGEELSRMWLQFCTSPTVVSDGLVGKKNSSTVESPSTRPICRQPRASFQSEQVLQRTTKVDVVPRTDEEGGKRRDLDGKTSVYAEGVFPIAGQGVLTNDFLDGKTSTHDEDVLPNAEVEALSSDGHDGGMDYENEYDDMSNDTTCIVQKVLSCSINDQEGTSALKECPREIDPLDIDMRQTTSTPSRDDIHAGTIAGSVVEYSPAQQDEVHIDQFMNSLQVTPGVDESRLERANTYGESVSNDVNLNGQSPPGNVGRLSPDKELITPGKDGSKRSAEAQDECTPVLRKPKPKRSRKGTKAKKVDSPLDAGSKWSDGKRKSTRIRSKPLDWWRGERMLYGRVHSSLNTLIGIKHLSPDPVWPRPRDKKNKMVPPKFKVDSFVSDEHKELLRLAAQ